ncbi:phytanoyl-CoA dioxygenase family protein [Actinomadura viridis]|uniref:Ectoine hydroxylase n=1 Tax=Actinomadura viridis TaxID=58110 RepID=A0A931GKW7_9ACTN|nr:phytanoyl-CoA dioxygenase family protein [Actinomadura viridis]MBG6090545.1 ectoine hydroxylase [Actinomadura viridis]
MALTDKDLAEYDERGFLLLDSVFSAGEVEALRRTLKRDWDVPGPHRIMEEDGRSVRAVYASHTRWKVFADLIRSRRLLEPARRLVGAPLYLHQFKINTKAAFGGEEWSWHQDFVVWHVVDGMPAPRAVNVAVFLDDVTEFNGPVVFIPGSHRHGTAVRGPRSESPRSAQHVDPADFALTPAELTGLVRAHGMDGPKGGAGSVVLFHPEIVHGSGSNISPFSRNLLILTYNDVANAPRPAGAPRPEYLIGRDTSPLEPDDVTLREGPLEEI